MGMEGFQRFHVYLATALGIHGILTEKSLIHKLQGSQLSSSDEVSENLIEVGQVLLLGGLGLLLLIVDN
jgi:hypothetical protein